MFQESVAEFHEAKNVSPPQPMSKRLLYQLTVIGAELISHAEELERTLEEDRHDLRVLRAHLMLEELGETLVAMGKGDELEAFDGILDLLYVTFGTCVTFDWPSELGFKEVHRSNMLKQANNGPRLRDKGDAWSPPRLEQVMTCHRDGDCDGLTHKDCIHGSSAI